MPKQTVTVSGLEQRLPHRFENMLLDTLWTDPLADPKRGDFQVTITESDPAGRAIFFENRTGTPTLISPFFLEILALGSISGLGGAQGDDIALFAAISNYEKKVDFAIGQPIRGEFVAHKSKSRFFKVSATLFDPQGNVAVTADLMAILATKNDLTTAKIAPAAVSGSAPAAIVKTAPLSFKSPWMSVCDGLTEIDLGTGMLTGVYTYPIDHPFVKGHFPENPVMMGVMQWMTASDALAVLAQHLDGQGQLNFGAVTGDAQITKLNGDVVADIRQFRVVVGKGASGIWTDMVATQKVAFRSTVLPGDTILTRLSNLQFGY
ncbi:MAG: hypothetical protein AAB066_01875 [Candidatus Margulisiibacteriota bacterium]